MVRVDSHCHLWDLSRGDYDWLDTSNPAMQPIARDFQYPDIAPFLAASGINEVIVVQAAATQDETNYLLSLANMHSEIVGVVGWADIEFERAEVALEQWANHSKFKGIRPMLQDIEHTDWLISAPHATVWSHLENLGLRLDALVQPRHLAMLYDFCKSNEALPVVIDHAAKPKQAFAGDKDAFDAWAKDMQRLAADTQAFCKLSGLLTELSSTALENPQPVIKPMVDLLLDSFGPSRLMWGSDWPVLTLASTYAKWDAMTTQLLGELSQDEQQMILGGSAAQFYGLE